MNPNIRVTGKTPVTEALLQRLNELNMPAHGCFYESTYCVKVPIKNLSQAMNLGMALGDKFGKITHHTSPQGIVFIETRCQARSDVETPPSDPAATLRVAELADSLFTGVDNVKTATKARRKLPDFDWLKKWMYEHAVGPADTLAGPGLVVELGERIAKHYFTHGDMPSRYVVGVFALETSKRSGGE